MDKRQKDQTWNPIEPGNPRRDVLADWIADHFTAGVGVDLSRFKRRDNTIGNGIELMSEGGLEGYVFVTSQIDGSYESKMETIRRLYEGTGKEILIKFTDYNRGLAGFDWRKVD